MVANHIGTDWAKLYRKLPMIPSRGDAERDEDLVKIVTNQWRSVVYIVADHPMRLPSIVL